MTEDPAHTPLTEAEHACYNQLDEDVTAGRVPAIGRGTRRDGSRVSDTELDAVPRAPPGPGRSGAPGGVRPPRRQVRLPEHTDATLTAYVEKHATPASAVTRDAVEPHLATA